MPSNAKTPDESKNEPIEELVARYFDGLRQENKKASADAFRCLLDAATGRGKALAFVKTFSDGLKQSPDLSDKALKQLDKDMNRWFGTIQKSIKDFSTLPLLSGLKHYPRQVPAPFAQALEDFLRPMLPSAQKELLMPILLLRVHWGQTTADTLLAMAKDYDFITLWYNRFKNLYRQDPTDWRFADLADLMFCCGELRFELEKDFVELLCQTLRYKIVVDNDQTKADIIRAIHAMAMIDATEQGAHPELKRTANTLCTYIEDISTLDAEDQRLLCLACQWFNIENGPEMPERIALSRANAELREKFEAQRKNSEIVGQPLPEKKIEKRSKKIKGGTIVDLTLDHEKQDSVPQMPEGFGAAFNIAGSTNADVETEYSPETPPHPIHIVADDVLWTRQHIVSGQWRHDTKWVLKGSHYLESQVCSIVLGGPVIHVRGNQLHRLEQLSGFRFAEAVGEFTWAAMPNADDTQLIGSHDLIQNGKAYNYQPS